MVEVHRGADRREGLTGRYVSRLLDLAFLAPEVVQAIMEGRQPVDLTAERITQEIELPMAWEAQREALGV